MAKRQSWITFTGLRFVKKFTTRNELICEIRRFFGERRIRSFGQLRVSFRRTKPSGYKGIYYPCTRHIVVALGWIYSREQFWRTLGHELDHVAWHIEGKEWDDHSKPHRERSHELRAFATGSEFTGRLG